MITQGDASSVPIEDCGFSELTKASLRSLGIKTLEQLADYTWESLEKRLGNGRVQVLVDVKDFLKKS